MKYEQETGKTMPPTVGRVVPKTSQPLYPSNVKPTSELEKLKTFESGAKSSGQAVRYDLLPREFLRRVAQRFTEGSVKYEDFNYRKGFGDEAFIRDRINHLQEHLNAFITPQNNEEYKDDNLAAIGWAVAILIELDSTEHGHKLLSEIRAKTANRIFYEREENFPLPYVRDLNDRD